MTPLLELEPLAKMDFDREDRGSFFIAKQNNTNISRKILAPKLKHYFINCKDFRAKEKGAHDKRCQ